MFAIETKKLTKYYLGKKVVGIKDLNLQISPGEVFGFIGPNGAGKTTTIRVLLDLIRPSSGSATIFGKDIHKNSVSIKEDIGFLPGEIFLPDYMNGSECIKYYANFHKSTNEEYLRHLIKLFRLDTSKNISGYSKGNKQKLAIVLAFMHKPKLLILDEPTSGLDPLNQNAFYKVVKDTKDWGATVFLSTHLLQEAQNMCDRVGIIKDGKLIKIENIDDFRKNNIREIHFETTEDIPIPELTIDGVKEVRKEGYGYHIITVGQNANIIKHLSRYNFSDMKVLEPSLEEMFMHYYSGKEE